MTKEIIQGLKRQTAEVVADKKFSKVMDAYVEEDKRELFSVTLFNGKPNFSRICGSRLWDFFSVSFKGLSDLAIMSPSSVTTN